MPPLTTLQSSRLVVVAACQSTSFAVVVVQARGTRHGAQHRARWRVEKMITEWMGTASRSDGNGLDNALNAKHLEWHGNEMP